MPLREQCNDGWGRWLDLDALSFSNFFPCPPTSRALERNVLGYFFEEKSKRIKASAVFSNSACGDRLKNATEFECQTIAMPMCILYIFSD